MYNWANFEDFKLPILKLIKVSGTQLVVTLQLVVLIVHFLGI